MRCYPKDVDVKDVTHSVAHTFKWFVKFMKQICIRATISHFMWVFLFASMLGSYFHTRKNPAKKKITLKVLILDRLYGPMIELLYLWMSFCPGNKEDRDETFWNILYTKLYYFRLQNKKTMQTQSAPSETMYSSTWTPFNGYDLGPGKMPCPVCYCVSVSEGFNIVNCAVWCHCMATFQCHCICYLSPGDKDGSVVQCQPLVPPWACPEPLPSQIVLRCVFLYLHCDTHTHTIFSVWNGAGRCCWLSPLIYCSQEQRGVWLLVTQVILEI